MPDPVKKKAKKKGRATVCTGSINDYSRNAKSEKVNQAVNRFDQFMIEKAHEFSSDKHSDKLGIRNERYSSESTFDTLKYDDFCNPDLFGVFFHWLATEAEYLDGSHKILSYSYTHQLVSTLKEHIVNTVCWDK